MFPLKRKNGLSKWSFKKILQKLKKAQEKIVSWSGKVRNLNIITF